MRASVSDDTLASLTGKLLEQEKSLKNDQETLHEFKKENNVSVLQEVTSAAGVYLAKLKSQMAELRMEETVLKLLTDNEKVLPQTAIAEGKAAADASDSKAATAAAGQAAPPDYQAAKQQAQWLKLQRDEWSEFMRPEHPKMIKLNEEIAKLEKLVEFFRDQGRDQLISGLEHLRLKINATEETIKDWEGRVVDANSRMTEFDKLRINVARSQALYDQLLRLLQNVDVNKNIDQESMTVLQRATLPIEQERLSLRLAVAGAVGLFLGLGMLVLWERRDDRLFSLTEFRQQFEEPVVCQVPRVSRTWRKGATGMVNQMDLHSLFAESFRHLHSSLILGSQPRSVLVTSAVSGEGKSTVAINLAVTAAMNGSRVLLIDADIHRGRMHELLEVGASPGLAECQGENAAGDLPVVLTRVNNLWLMPCGGHSPGDASFLNSAMLEELTQLYREYDLVVVDSAPVFAGDDALRLGQTVDGVLLVIRSAYSRAGAITRILEQLYQRRAKVLGFVLNGVDDNVDHCHRYRQKEYRKISAAN
jgi:capsular exopolysaccharide synthesis family protein